MITKLLGNPSSKLVNKIDNEKKAIRKNSKKGKSSNDNQIMMDLANLDDDKLDRLNTSLEKQKGILDNLNSMTPVIKSLDSFSTMLTSK